MKQAILVPILFALCTAYLAADELVVSRAAPTDLASNNPHFVIVRAEILEVSASKTSFENPAVAKIRIIDVIRGRNRTVPREVLAQLNPALANEMMVSPMKGNYDLKPEARVQQFDMPAVGSQILISYCCVDSDENAISTQGNVVAWSVQNESTIRGNMAVMEASPRLQGGLFVLLLATTVAGILVARTRRLSLQVKLFITSLVVYAVYETGISSYTNIRVDLLLILPLLFLNVLALAWNTVSSVMRRLK